MSAASDDESSSDKSQDALQKPGRSADPPRRHREKRVSTAPTLTSPDIHKVGVRPTTFWPDKPAVWFAQLEGQFALAGVTQDSTKYYHAISNLDSKYAEVVEDVITSPPTTDMYAKLKAELIKRLSVFKENQVRQLLMHDELGDRKPSQFLRHLQKLAGKGVPDDFVKTIWTSRLPKNMQPILACQDTASLATLAELADRIQDIAPSTPQVAAASTSRAESVLDTMARQIAELTRQVQALSSSQHTPRSRTRSSEQRRDRSASRRSQSNYRKYPLCWYHAKFGSQARKCTKPCDYQSGNAKGNL